jgi:hypothetical protein
MSLEGDLTVISLLLLMGCSWMWISTTVSSPRGIADRPGASEYDADDANIASKVAGIDSMWPY